MYINMADYNNLVIYKLSCKDNDVKDLYVGQTTNFKSRFNSHKSNCNCNSNFLLYTTINLNGGWNNWVMEKIEKFPCLTRIQAKEREYYWIKNMKPNLNNKIPTRTFEMWKKDNYDNLAEYKKQYYIKNKSTINEKNTAYNKTEKYKEYKKQYDLNRKDEKRLYDKKRRDSQKVLK